LYKARGTLTSTGVRATVSLKFSIPLILSQTMQANTTVAKGLQGATRAMMAANNAVRKNSRSLLLFFKS
jgi:hypothetical protein